jgi:hypothetical protein
MGKRALLAQGLKDVYSKLPGKYLMVPEAFKCGLAASSNVKDPKSFWEAMQCPDANLWYKAAMREMEAHIENGTWGLVKLPAGHKAIGSKWVFKVKRNANGTVECYKGCVVA